MCINHPEATDLINLHSLPRWQELSISLQQPFLGGPTHVRDLIKPNQRKFEISKWSATDIHRFVCASDSQPGAQLAPLTTNSKATLFIYGSHLHLRTADLDPKLWESRGWNSYTDIPDGSVLATRSGAVLLKTAKEGTDADYPSAIWLTHGRVMKPLGVAIEPKIPLVEAIREAGHGSILDGVVEWPLEEFTKREGTWQEVYVDNVTEDGKMAQMVYWDF